jgi:Ca-activated chloride channel family protein
MKGIITIIVFLVFSSVFYGQDTNALISKGNHYYQQSQFDLAETQYRKSLEADPKNAKALFNLANALQMQKKYDEAIQLLDDFPKSTNNTTLVSSAYYNQGVAYTKLKNLEASIESYKKALRLNPNDQETRENLQKALLEQKKQQQQQKQQQKKPEPKMSQKEAEQKLKLLQQKEKDLQQRLQNQSKQKGAGQTQDW